ncbi:hypothetical protein VOLCADRAFT_82151 [Volvox carteri f. nagariensis]|uniref:Uncharacterized protein n=1 Tax=Volvox carteri f. nagariensis TaxID=3068 RepID=D8U3Q8_VOLCA|nr:uncharacterized protein VOLCADRAFT_82151 [Volvox carteri f. nagariensis]EFJ45652.1 hypothetical protein VOLCADRAFT_82151 [Volvox carteri f. nagariensis]|eukprot:XP_002953342.1 hypothetical protein VOLCADRAFT_82151 [Volvox carteri f. nagariensis]
MLFSGRDDSGPYGGSCPQTSPACWETDGSVLSHVLHLYIAVDVYPSIAAGILPPHLPPALTLGCGWSGVAGIAGRLLAGCGSCRHRHGTCVPSEGGAWLPVCSSPWLGSLRCPLCPPYLHISLSGLHGLVVFLVITRVEGFWANLTCWLFPQFIT